MARLSVPYCGMIAMRRVARTRAMTTLRRDAALLCERNFSHAQLL